jgi:hypothetical protein
VSSPNTLKEQTEYAAMRFESRRERQNSQTEVFFFRDYGAAEALPIFIPGLSDCRCFFFKKNYRGDRLCSITFARSISLKAQKYSSHGNSFYF